MAASQPSKALRTATGSRTSPSARSTVRPSSRDVSLDLRRRQRTDWPAPVSLRTTTDPMKPPPPVTRIGTRYSRPRNCARSPYRPRMLSMKVTPRSTVRICPLTPSSSPLASASTTPATSSGWSERPAGPKRSAKPAKSLPKLSSVASETDIGCPHHVDANVAGFEPVAQVPAQRLHHRLGGGHEVVAPRVLCPPRWTRCR